MWRLVDDPPLTAAAGDGHVDLLQGYDEYFVSYKDSRDLARDPLSAEAPAVLPLRLPGTEESPFLHVIAVGVRAEQRGFEAQAERLAAHWGVEHVPS
ncbi:hypothetical protein D3C74_400800 [compost metagenome]